MPAYNYYPVTYQNPYQQSFYQNPYQMQQQVPQQAQVASTQSPLQTNGIIWVSGDAEADAYPIAPNNAVTLWHRTLPVVYFKQADASGKPLMKVYDLVEHKTPSTAENAPETLTIDFATKEEVAVLQDAIQTLKGELKSIRKEMKKREVVDDDE